MDAKIEIYAGRVGLETHRLILLEKKQNKHVIRKSYIYISTQRYSPSTCAVEKRGEKLPRARGHHENNEW